MSLDIDLYYEVDHKGDIKDEKDARLVVFDYNITHNLNKLGMALDCYEQIWRPEEIQAVYAKDIVEQLVLGLGKLVGKIESYKQYEPENGWGTIDGFKKFLTDYIDACTQYPNSKISCCR
jgi:hypothetical protein